MNQLISIVNKLQNTFNEVGLPHCIDFPQIAVVGSQSSGKSSLIEAIVGFDFLPRGSGIVTRRPLVLQLTHISEAEMPCWGQFSHKKGQKFFDFSKIRDEIEKDTDTVAGGGKALSDVAISLQIFSADVPDLTLIDLPGMTKIAIGDQPKDVEQQIRKLVMNYIKKKNCIILAVTAANQDIANSDALQIAKEVDPNGERTVGVLTKLDLMDRGTDASEILLNRTFYLKLGYIGVVLRGQEAINSRKSFKESLEDEKRFFADKGAVYSRVNTGTAFLSKRLSAILLHHIQCVLPGIRAEIDNMHCQAEECLRELGASELTPDTLLVTLQSYTNAVNNSLKGTVAKAISEDNELKGGARIRNVFSKFSRVIREMDPFDGLTDEVIWALIRNSKGKQSFQLLAKQQVAKFRHPSLCCADFVFLELIRICEDSQVLMRRFPLLHDRVNEEVFRLLTKHTDACKQFINLMIDIELGFINTNHPHFTTQDDETDLTSQSALQYNSMYPPYESRKKSTLDRPAHIPVPMDLNERQKNDIKRMRESLESYIKIVAVSITDKVQKAVMCFLVKFVEMNATTTNENLHCVLSSTLITQAKTEDLLKEDEDIYNRRIGFKKMLHCLEQAKIVLNEVADFEF